MEVNFIETAAKQLGYSVMRYSGRAMFGRQCLGIVVPADERLLFTATLLQHLVLGYVSNLMHNPEFSEDELTADMEELMGRFKDDLRMDNLGNDFVIYFPSIEVTQ